MNSEKKSMGEFLLDLRSLRNLNAHGMLGKRLDHAIQDAFSARGFEADDAQIARTVRFINSAEPGVFLVPPVIQAAVGQLLKDRSAEFVLDPWAGTGQLAETAMNATGARITTAIVIEQELADFGRVFNPSLTTIVGDPLVLIRKINGPVDVVASVLPLGIRDRDQSPVKGNDGQPVRLRGDYAERLMIESAQRLREDGIALFVVDSAFFYRTRSAFHHLNRFGLFVHAALALPARTFMHHGGPRSGYLVVIGKNKLPNLFVAQLTDEEESNRQAIQNFLRRKVGGALQFGRYVENDSFEGIEKIYFEERVKKFERKIKCSPVPMAHLAKRFIRGHRERPFEDLTNAVFVPIVGTRHEAVTLMKRSNTLLKAMEVRLSGSEDRYL